MLVAGLLAAAALVTASAMPPAGWGRDATGARVFPAPTLVPPSSVDAASSCPSGKSSAKCASIATAAELVPRPSIEGTPEVRCAAAGAVGCVRIPAPPSNFLVHSAAPSAQQPVYFEKMPASLWSRTALDYISAVVDISGDGLVDLVVEPHDWLEASDILIDDGKGSWTWSTDTAYGIDLNGTHRTSDGKSNPRGAAFADVDNDGDLDALIGGLIYIHTPGASPPYAVESSSVSILDWTRLPAPPAPPLAPMVGLGDLLGIGAGAPAGTDSGGGGGGGGPPPGFGRRLSADEETSDPKARSHRRRLNTQEPFRPPDSTLFADVNGDGLVDALVCEAGCFGRTEESACVASGCYYSGGVCQLNSYTGYADSVDALSRCALFLNDPSTPGEFVTDASLAYNEAFLQLGIVKGTSFSLAFADVDSDGDLDIVSADKLYMNGGGTSGFSAGASFAVDGASGQTSAVADVDGDGQPMSPCISTTRACILMTSAADLPPAHAHCTLPRRRPGPRRRLSARRRVYRKCAHRIRERWRRNLYRGGADGWARADQRPSIGHPR